MINLTTASFYKEGISFDLKDSLGNCTYVIKGEFRFCLDSNDQDYTLSASYNRESLFWDINDIHIRAAGNDSKDVGFTSEEIQTIMERIYERLEHDMEVKLTVGLTEVAKLERA